MLRRKQGRMVWAKECTGRNCPAGRGDPKDLKVLPAGPGQGDATFGMVISGFIVLKRDTDVEFSSGSRRVVVKCLSPLPTLLKMIGGRSLSAYVNLFSVGISK